MIYVNGMYIWYIINCDQKALKYKPKSNKRAIDASRKNLYKLRLSPRI